MERRQPLVIFLIQIYKNKNLTIASLHSVQYTICVIYFLVYYYYYLLYNAEFVPIMFSLIPSGANDPQGLMRR